MEYTPQPPPSLRKMSPPPTKSSSSGLFVWIIIIALLTAGGGYAYFTFQYKQKIKSIYVQLHQQVIDTRQYGTVTAKAVEKKLRKTMQQLKVSDTRYRVYITILPRKEFLERLNYHKSLTLKGYKRARKKILAKIPGCSITDAMDPGLTLRNLNENSGNNARRRGKSLTGRIKGILSNDGQAVLTGRTNEPEREDAPVQTVLAVDILAHLKTGPIKGKLWFHRSCFFYQGRRSSESNAGIDQLLQK